MTVPSNRVIRVEEAGDNVQTDFTFDFVIANSGELKVYKLNSTTRAQTLQTITTDYTVEINGVDNASTDPGGTVTYVVAPTSSEISLILSDYDLSQTTDFPAGANAPSKPLENMPDKLTYIAKQHSESLGRSGKMPEGSTIDNLELPLPNAGSAPVWNEAATGLANSVENIDNLVSGPMQIAYSKTEYTSLDTYSLTAGTWQAISGISVSITPRSANSNILVACNIAGGYSLGGILLFRVVRVIDGNSTVLDASTSSTAGNRVRASFSRKVEVATDIATSSFITIDSPNTTESVLYRVDVMDVNGSGTFTVNRAYTDSDTSAYPAASSSIILCELYS